MTGNPAIPPAICARQFARSILVLLSCAAILTGGCAVKRRPSIPWNTAILVRPVSPARAVEAADISKDPVPELRPEAPAFSLPMSSPKSPARPHVAPPTSAAGIDSEKRDAPLIELQLSPQESAAAQQQTNESLSNAERNLAAMRGKKLSAAQSDLLSKIQEFLKDAREAARAQDWSRARSLSKKAQLLSEELVGSN
jgi:hypothetical protein